MPQPYSAQWWQGVAPTYGAINYQNFNYQNYPYQSQATTYYGTVTVTNQTYWPQTAQPQLLSYSHLMAGTSGTGLGSPWIALDPVPETPERRRERRRQARLDDLAAQRAKALLLEHLNAEQRAEYEEHQYFHVLSQGGRLYRIKHGSVGNVYKIGLDGNEEHKFCIHTRDHMPTEDTMLAQMLLLVFDEEQFLTTANRHW